MSLSSQLINDFITLFVAIDPLGTVPFLLPLTRGMRDSEKKSMIVRATVIASLVLAGFGIFGHVLLSAMGISFAAFRIAGGLVLFIVGARMIFEHGHGVALEAAQSGGTGDEGAATDPAVFPLAIPFMAGPATTLAVMVATRQETFNPYVLSAKIGVLALVMGLTFLILLSSGRIHRALGKTGSEIIGRVMGILLAALAAESVIRGVQEAFLQR